MGKTNKMYTCWYFSPICIMMHGSENKKFVSYIFCFSVPIHRFYVQNSLLCTVHNVFLQCLNHSLTHFGYNLTGCLEIWKRYCRRVYESPVAKNRSVTANLSWTVAAAQNMAPIFKTFGPTKDNLLLIFSFQPTVWQNFLGEFCLQL